MKNKQLLFLSIILLITLFMQGCDNHISHAAKVEDSTSTGTSSINNFTVNETKKTKADKQKLQQTIRDYLNSSNLSGSVAVVKGQHTLFNDGVGYADKEKKILNQSTTTYPIGSITKTFVATSVMLLQEQHKLNIQDSVSKYLPNFPNGSKLKLFHLLTHTSGIQKPSWNISTWTPISIIQNIEKKPIKFPPGTQWDYLDANYMVLGYIVEKVSGMTLYDFIQQNIFDKVSMKESGFITAIHWVPFTAVGYFTNGNKLEVTKYLSIRTLFGCGDIYTTAYDLTQYDNALLNGRLVSQDSLNQILTPGSSSNYGLGLYNKGKLVCSIGVLGGFYSMHAYYKEEKLSMAILLNARNKSTDIQQIMTTLHRIVSDSAYMADIV